MTFAVIVSDKTNFSVEAETIGEADALARTRLTEQGKVVAYIRHLPNRLKVLLGKPLPVE